MTFTPITPTLTMVLTPIGGLLHTINEPDYVPLTSNLDVKYKQRMLYFPIDFGKLTLDGLVDTGAFSSAIPGADLIRLSVYHKKGPGT